MSILTLSSFPPAETSVIVTSQSKSLDVLLFNQPICIRICFNVKQDFYGSGNCIESAVIVNYLTSERPCLYATNGKNRLCNLCITSVLLEFTIGLIVRIAKRPESHQCRPYYPESPMPVFPSNGCCFHGGLRHQGQKDRTSTLGARTITIKVIAAKYKSSLNIL